MVNYSRGRPKGTSKLREKILSTAREQFLQQGYAHTSVREIARVVGCDHAMVNYYFGSKQKLFAESMYLAISPGDAVCAISRRAAEEGNNNPRVVADILVRGIIGLWETPHVRESVLPNILPMLSDDHLRANLLEFMEEEIFTELSTLVKRLSPHGASLEARIAGVIITITGTIMGRYLFQVPALANPSAQWIVAMMSRQLTAALTS